MEGFLVIVIDFNLVIKGKQRAAALWKLKVPFQLRVKQHIKMSYSSHNNNTEH